MNQETLNKFIDFVKSGQSPGSYSLAKRTVLLIQDYLQSSDFSSILQLYKEIQNVGTTLTKAEPTETVPGNMVKRILKIVREEYHNSLKSNTPETFDENQSLAKMFTTAESDNEAFGAAIDQGKVKDSILYSISELLDELETCGESIANQALEHIYSEDVIMTIGRSRTVEAFLKHAARSKRTFQVIVAECAPFYKGWEFATSLAKEGIDTVLIPDSAIFSVMSRVNKVVIGAHSIMANGGIKAVSGAYTLALAAKHYSVPLLVCTGMFKLNPQYLVSYDQLEFNKFGSPQDMINYKEAVSSSCHVVNPVFDYVLPELITIFVSNIGGTSPNYVYRWLRELYQSQDEVV